MSASPAKILILDDSDAERNRFVEEFGRVCESDAQSAPLRYEVQGARTIEEAVFCLNNSGPFSFVLADQYNQSENDLEWGFEATSILRETQRDLLVILFSNLAPALVCERDMRGFRDRAYDAGAVRYLEKPHDPSTIIDVAHFLATLNELAGLKQELDRHVRGQHDVCAVISLAITAGLLILDEENIVWFVSDDYRSLIGCDPQGQDEFYNPRPLPWRLQADVLPRKCLRTIENVLRGGDQRPVEDTVFRLRTQSPGQGLFLHVETALLKSPSGSAFAAACQTITELPHGVRESLTVRDRGKLILEAMAEHGFERARAYKIEQGDVQAGEALPQQKSRAFAHAGHLGRVDEQAFYGKEPYHGAADEYIAEVIRDKKPKIIWTPEHPDVDGQLDELLQTTWPKVVAPLLAGEIGVGGLFVEVSPDQAESFEKEGSFAGISQYLDPLAQLLVQSEPTPIDERRQRWCRERNRLAHDLMRLHEVDNPMNKLADVLVSVSGCDEGYIRIREGRLLKLEGSHGGIGTAIKESNERRSVSLDNRCAPCSRVARTHVPSYETLSLLPLGSDEACRQHEASRSQAELAAMEGMRERAVLPFLYEGLCYGVLVLYSGEQGFFSPAIREFLWDVATDASPIVASVVVAQERLNAHRRQETVRADRLYEIISGFQFASDERELLWRFAIGMTHGEAVGFNRIVLLRGRIGLPLERAVAFLGHGPRTVAEGKELQHKLENGGLTIDLHESLSQFVKSGNRVPDSPLMCYLRDRSPGFLWSESSPIVALPFVDDVAETNGQEILRSYDVADFGCDPGFMEFLQDLEVAKCYCFKLKAEEPDGYLVGICDFVYLDHPDVQQSQNRARELIQNLTITFGHRRLERDAQFQVGKSLIGKASHRLSSLIPPMIDQVKLAQQAAVDGNLEKVNVWIGKLSTSIADANVFLNELTDFTKLEVRPDEYLLPTDLMAWLHQELTNRFPHQPIEFAGIADESAGRARIHVARRELMAAFLELVEDSIRHSEAPTLRINLRACLRKDQLVVIYEDNGRGLSEVVRKAFFRPMATGEGMNLGLGLSIVSYTIREHGGVMREDGNLSAEELPLGRTYASGVYFTIQLPLEGN